MQDRAPGATDGSELEPGEFDFDASTDQAWALFADRLAEVVSVVEDGASLTLGTLSGDRAGAPAVTFTCLHRPTRDAAPRVLVQVVGCSADQVEQLRGMGWEAPGDTHPAPWLEHDQDDSEWVAQQAVTALREVLGVQHPVFLAPDHLAEVLQPVPVASEDGRVLDGVSSLLDAHDGVATMPSGHDQLDRMVATELTHLFGHEPIRDEAGDYAIRVGSTMVFIRPTADAREVVLFSALVHDVEGRSRATEVLNDLNGESRFGRFSLYRDRVYVSMSLLARPFVPAHLHEGFRIMSQIADLIDDELAAKLRGRVTFTDGD